ncbi:helix-turn-helix transcriptional regulator [Salipaludibacillus sp. LMS25]|uniref:helix-turn-helix transcriptional regulator n=1 Tax=Salipaludibacillus sp. LMS25 TaxID=2924031 RepID=UPI0020D0732F|nr:helix-turn-helix transcriptional regulator [Salipaludibacillus sp. LMS25]UTR13191.1 helix-turn-helix transcriptional regulator [Salipaludibacillus sp. LMS25]
MEIEKVKNALTMIERKATSLSDYQRRVLNGLKQIVPYQAGCFTTVDKDTLLSTGAVTDECIEELHARLFENEYRQEDLHSYKALVASNSRAAALRQAMQLNNKTCVRWQQVIRPAGFTDELRVVVMKERECKGFMTLFRGHQHPFFNDEDEEILSQLSQTIAEGLESIENQLSLSFQEKPKHTEDTGVLTFSEKIELMAGNERGTMWLDKLRERENIQGSRLVPRPIRAICSAATASLKNKKVMMRLRGEAFLTLEATPLIVDKKVISLAVLIRRAERDAIFPYLTNLYRLTNREREVLEKVMKGLSTKEIAAACYISPYTVQDHLKAIFEKTHVTSRRELVRKFG